MPAHGSIIFSADILAITPGVETGHLIKGKHGPLFSYLGGDDYDYQRELLDTQQAIRSLYMLNLLDTGELFDWLVSGKKACALIERLPSTVTGVPGVGLDKTYTQIIEEVDMEPGVSHNYAIRYTRSPDDGADKVEYLIDGKVVAKVHKAGIPLDVQRPDKYADIIYPSVGPGEILKDKMNTMILAHGIFSLLDEFPFQHPDRPDLSVPIPVSERIWGQGVRATFDNSKVTTETKNE